MDVLTKVPVREQEAAARAKNFDEVCLGYNKEEAMEEAARCINCKNAQCVKGCPVAIDIPAFIEQVKLGNIEEAYQIISQSSALPAVCGRVCPQESQCEGKCIRGIKGDPVSIGKLGRFVADWARENNIKPEPAKEKNGKKVAVIGSGPAGLTCAGDLARLGYDVTIFEALHEAGGVLVYGIPEFRLPKEDVVAKEIANVERGTHFSTVWSDKPVVMDFTYLRVVLESGKPISYQICIGFTDAENRMMEQWDCAITVDLSEYAIELKKAIIKVLVDKFF